MRTAIVSAHASPLAAQSALGAGGQSIHVAEMAAALARRGHDVTVYTRRHDAARPRRVLAPPGYTVVQVDAGPAETLPEDHLLEYLGDFGRTLAALWDDDLPDVAHAYSWTSGIATELAARDNDVPTVQTFRELGAVKRRHHGPQDTTPTARLKLEKLVARHASWIAAACTDELGELMRLGRPRSQMSVVPCGVDVTMFSPEGPCGERSDRPRLLAGGTFLPHNGFDTMIIALSGIPDAELVIVGGPAAALVHDDPEVRRLSAVATHWGVADRVVFTGGVPHDQMPMMLRSADVVLCTPWYGGPSMIPLDAMACGVPVIASDVGGLRDTIVHDVTGRLVPPRNPRAIAEAASAILHDSFLRRSLGLAGRDRVCARYTWEGVTEEALRIYGRLADTGTSSQSPPIVMGHPTIQDSPEI